jgi:hypothetical protein
MATAIQTTQRALQGSAPLPIPWRDPHNVAPAELSAIIQRLQQACELEPQSADLRTCLGMAHAMNYDPYSSIDAFEEARSVDPSHFWAQYKYAEILYRLRALPKSEEETLRALDLARDGHEINIARKQLQEIRRLRREGSQKPAWEKPLGIPFLLFLLGAVFLSLVAVIR